MTRTLTENASSLPGLALAAAAPVQASVALDSAPRFPRRWVIGTCLLLAISGGIRIGRDLQFYGISRSSKACPFPLSELPSALGTWSKVANSDGKLDPEIARLAGSSDYVIRSYADSRTGEVVSLLLLYGLADSVFAHTPEVCYKAAGYSLVPPIVDHEFKLPGSAAPIRYSSVFVGASAAGATQYSEVIWSFWHAGTWLPEVASRWKMFRSSPGMFKIQIQRPASALSSDDSPSESLLKEIVREINTRLERSKVGSAGVLNEVPKSG